MERIDTDLDNTSVEDSLCIVISLTDSFRNVTHDEELLGLFSLIDCMVKNEIKN